MRKILTAQELSLQHISNILWAFVSFMQLSGPMVGAFLKELRLRLRHATFNAQQLSNLLWSLCIAEVAPCTSLSRIFSAKALSMAGSREFAVFHATLVKSWPLLT